MNRYEQLFQRLQSRNQGAFIPFVTLGDPSADVSLQIIDALVAGGADALEIGIPFSDPLADGPVIQDANLRAFAAGITPARCFELISQIRAKYPELPVGLLMYANLVFHNGIEQFYETAANAGVDSVLIADVPLHESQPFRDAALANNIAPVFICPPDADDKLLETLTAAGKGYTYLLSRAGVTGTEKRAEKSLADLTAKLTALNAAPPVQGFGISEPEQVQESLRNGAAGAISGSAVVKIIAANLDNAPVMCQKLREFTQKMKNATQL